MGRTLKNRLARLCDPDTLKAKFVHSGSVYFTGVAKINARKVVIIATDPDPISEPPDLLASLVRCVNALQKALKDNCPVVFLHDSPATHQSGRTAFQGANVEFMVSDNGMGRIYYELGRLLGQVPVVSAVFGHMAQAQAFPALMGHGVVMVEGASISVARPDAVKSMLGESISYGDLGGSRLHGSLVGDCDAVVSSEEDALDWINKYLGYLPSSPAPNQSIGNLFSAKTHGPMLSDIIPSRLNRPFAVLLAIHSLVGAKGFLELGSVFAGEAVTGFAKMGGQSFGIAANNAKVNGGILFPETCHKLSRFIETCDTLGLPMVFLADAPGFMIGGKVEKAGIVNAGARLFKSISQTRSPRLCIVLRRAYTAGMYAMSGSGFSPSAIYALPTARIAVYGPEVVDRFLRELDLPGEQKEEIRRKMEEDSCLETLVDQGFLTGIIEPDDVQKTIFEFLSQTRN